MLNSLKWFSKNWTPTKLMSLRWEMVRKRPNLFWSSWIEASTPLLHSCTSSPFRYSMLKFRYFEKATKIFFSFSINRFDEISLIKNPSKTRLTRIFDTFYFHEKIIIFKWQQGLVINFRFENGWADFCWKSYLRTSPISLIKWKLFRSKTLHFCRLFSSW